MKGTWFSVDFVLSRDGSQADNLRNSPNEAVLGCEITAKFKGSLKGRCFKELLIQIITRGFRFEAQGDIEADYSFG